MCLDPAIIGRGELLYRVPRSKVTFGSAFIILRSQMPRSARANMDNAPDPVVVQNTG